MTGLRWLLVLGWVALCAAGSFAQSPGSDEDVARRQLDSGRRFARQGNYAEALRDFRAVAETHSSSSVADDALLEIARYQLDVAGNAAEAATAVDAILKKYATSNSAPDAYVIAGRLALAKSRQPADLEAALANFERVYRLFPASDAVPRSLQLAGDALWHAKRLDEALFDLGRVAVEYPTTPAAADAHLGASRVLVSLGDPISAMEELQQVRARWPGSPQAATALSRITLLHRLYVRARNGPTYALTAETAGPTKIENLLALVATSRDQVYWASESAVGVASPANATPPPNAVKPRGLTLDATGSVVVFDGGLLKFPGGATTTFLVPKSGGLTEALNKVEAAVQLSNGDWVVAGEKGLDKFTRSGAYVALYSQVRPSRLAVNATDEVAAIDRDQKSVALFDLSGKLIGRIPFRGTGYTLENPEDLTYDAFGHLYVLDRGAIAVFGPYGSASAGAATTSSRGGPAASDRGTAYRLLTTFSEPEKTTTGFRKATAFALDSSGGAFLYDDRTQRILVYR